MYLVALSNNDDDDDDDNDDDDDISTSFRALFTPHRFMTMEALAA